jgi:hypothetical protein
MFHASIVLICEKKTIKESIYHIKLQFVSEKWEIIVCENIFYDIPEKKLYGNDRASMGITAH